MMTEPVRRLGLSIALVALASGASATAPVPRTSQDFAIVEPTGGQTLLSRWKGKVVVLEFVLVDCPHCARVSQLLAKLHKELGPRGFQPVGVAFDNGISGKKATDFALRVGATYPIGYSTAAAVDSYLGRTAAERVMVPQIVVIDRKGTIRAQSRPVRESALEDESHLRDLIETLLKESAGATTRERPALSPSREPALVMDPDR
ncbi:MAG TPA: TlpA disulfide reductase family protein [Vicinamibacteria bacterium]|nr:TlpA disulfide reductase family protein [Vicinamibacteria bacterium]